MEGLLSTGPTPSSLRIHPLILSWSFCQLSNNVEQLGGDLSMILSDYFGLANPEVLTENP